jgi:type IV pilus assembly protein PilA
MHNTSKKGFTLVEIMIVVVIIGLLAAMAIPAFQKVRSSSQEKAITNNLRQIASAAQQYMLEHGVTQVDKDSIVGTGKYVNEIATVAGETYPASVTMDATEISVSGGPQDGLTYTF